MFRGGVPQELLAAGFTPPPGPQPTVTGDRGANNDINTRNGEVGPHSSQALDCGPLAPWTPIPEPGTSGENIGLHSQSPGMASRPGRYHWGPGAGFSSGVLRAEEVTPVD
jgi:hypothetical protein